MNLKFVQMLIDKHEGFRRVVYTDSKGKATIGIGFNLTDPTAAETCNAHGLNLQALLKGSPISLSDAQAIRDDKLLAAKFAAYKLMPEFDTLPDDVQAVVLDMIFNMGEAVFSGFHLTIAAINAGNFGLAAVNMRNSDWFHEVGSRGIEDCLLMESAD